MFKFLLPTIILTCLATGLLAEDAWVPLFNGKDLTGWKASENPATFSVKEGELIVNGPRAHLFYEGEVNGAKFKNFELKLEIKTLPGSNSGVFIHTAFQQSGWPSSGYEIQVNNMHSDPKKTGGVYAVKDNFKAPAADNEWFTLRIVVKGKQIQTFVNDTPVVDYIEPDDWQAPKNFSGRKLGTGTIAIQGHDPKSIVHYKSISIRVLPD
jgi:hypothetical protein